MPSNDKLLSALAEIAREVSAERVNRSTVRARARRAERIGDDIALSEARAADTERLEELTLGQLTRGKRMELFERSRATPELATALQAHEPLGDAFVERVLAAHRAASSSAASGPVAAMEASGSVWAKPDVVTLPAAAASRAKALQLVPALPAEPGARPTSKGRGVSRSQGLAAALALAAGVLGVWFSQEGSVRRSDERLALHDPGVDAVEYKIELERGGVSTQRGVTPGDGAFVFDSQVPPVLVLRPARPLEGGATAEVYSEKERLAVELQQSPQGSLRLTLLTPGRLPATGALTVLVFYGAQGAAVRETSERGLNLPSESDRGDGWQRLSLPFEVLDTDSQ